MTPLLPEELGPPPFRFSASAGPTQGAAFTRPYKALVVAMVIISLAWWIRLWQQGHWGDHPGQGGGWFLLAIVLMAWTGWAVLRSRTRIDAEGIRDGVLNGSTANKTGGAGGKAMIRKWLKVMKLSIKRF